MRDEDCPFRLLQKGGAGLGRPFEQDDVQRNVKLLCLPLPHVHDGGGANDQDPEGRIFRKSLCPSP